MINNNGVDFGKCDFAIYIANLEKYNSGDLHGAWLALPATEEEIENAMKLAQGDSYELEYAIHDYQAPFQISEWSNVEQLNEEITELHDLMDRQGIDSTVLNHLLGSFDSIDDVKRVLEYGCVQVIHDARTLADALEMMYEYGDLYFGNIPDHVMQYFDWERYARDYELELDGQVIERVSDLGKGYAVIIATF